jgi:hypothetical protein
MLIPRIHALWLTAGFERTLEALYEALSALRSSEKIPLPWMPFSGMEAEGPMDTESSFRSSSPGLPSSRF